MYVKKIPPRHDCGTELTLQIIGGKWKPAILCHIKNDALRPSEIHRSIPKATPRVLNQQLKEMEADGLVAKKIFPGKPKKVEYYLTDFGKSLDYVIIAMEDWGNAHEKRLLALNK